MDEKDFKELLPGREDQTLRSGWRCPDEIKLAAYVDHHLDGAARESITAHLVNCDFCVGQVSFLARAADWPDPDRVPADVLRRARNLVTLKSGPGPIWHWRWVMASATAACLVLLFAFIAFRSRTHPAVNAPSEPLIAQQHQPDIVPLSQTSATPRVAQAPSVTKPRSAEPATTETRSGAQDLSPAVVFPRNGATLRRSELDFRWEPQADAVFYDVTVVTADGDLVREIKTEDTHLRITDDIQLAPGGKYFISIRAHLRQGKTVKYKIVSFRISE